MYRMDLIRYHVIKKKLFTSPWHCQCISMVTRSLNSSHNCCGNAKTGPWNSAGIYQLECDVRYWFGCPAGRTFLVRLMHAQRTARGTASITSFRGSCWRSSNRTGSGRLTGIHTPSPCEHSYSLPLQACTHPPLIISTHGACVLTFLALTFQQPKL